ncbi:MAG: type II toxin-antitoxin system ParD family antitoxin [Pseudomonadota bacterium]
MPTRNVLLTEHQSALIDRLVADGRYQNASEVLRDGLREVEQREDARARLADHVDDLLAEADGTPDDALVSVDTVLAQLRAKPGPE